MRGFFSGKILLSKLFLSVGITGGTILLSANHALADRFTEQVGIQLVAAARQAGYQGYKVSHEPFIGDLGNGGEDSITINLERGASYLITAVCDEDCRDIDLALYDDNGNLIASDVQKDDHPVIAVTPRWSVRYVIRVYMAQCSNAPCRYGIGTFGH